MSFDFKKLPKSLKKVLNDAGKQYDIKVKDYLNIVEKDGKKVIYIDYPFDSAPHMYRMNDEVEKIIENKTSELPALIHTIGTTLFGDNVSEFYNNHPADKGSGSWEIIIENLTCNDWLEVDVFLIPIDFEIEW